MEKADEIHQEGKGAGCVCVCVGVSGEGVEAERVFSCVPAEAATAGCNLVSSPFPTWPDQERASAVPLPAHTALLAQKEMVIKLTPRCF